MQIVQDTTPNKRSPRRAAVEAIVLHCTEGSADSAISWFRSPKSEVSAHYMVQKDGTIRQFVDEADEAWANGRVNLPTAALVVGKLPLNPNAYTISIEHEGFGELTAEQQRASLDLIADIAKRHKIPPDRDHILGHHEIYSLKSCPGKLDVDAHVALLVAPQPIVPGFTHPMVVFSPSLNDYLVVSRYVSDDEWYFIPLKSIVGGQRAGTPLSEMPTAP